MIFAPLGRSGLQVSRIGLGMMSYGDPDDQPWALTEEQAEPIVRRAVEAGITFFDTADVYSAGASERITGRLLRKLFARRDDYVLATKSTTRSPTGPTTEGCRASMFWTASTPSWADWESITSTCTRSTAGTRRRRSRRRSAPSTTPCAPARSATSAPRRWRRGSSPRPSTPLD
jgi:aryl-alcohol dehydrogenase-like predicted oxidoreductase